MCHNFNITSKHSIIAEAIKMMYSTFFINRACQEDARVAINDAEYDLIGYNPIHSLEDEWEEFSNAVKLSNYPRVGYYDLTEQVNPTSDYRRIITDPIKLVSPNLERLYYFSVANFCMDGVI